MKEELSRVDVRDVRKDITENYKDIKPEKEMSVKELNDAVKEEFDKVSNETVAWDSVDDSEKKLLSDEEKQNIKEDTEANKYSNEFDAGKETTEYTEKGLKEYNTGDRIEFEYKGGGSYKELKNVETDEDGHISPKEKHHVPADSASELDRDDGPCILMDVKDHRQTASWGNSKEAREYRAKQKELIDEGKFREALQMDIDDIREKFGDKYDDAISEMKQYVDKLESEGRI